MNIMLQILVISGLSTYLLIPPKFPRVGEVQVITFQLQLYGLTSEQVTLKLGRILCSYSLEKQYYFPSSLKD